MKKENILRIIYIVATIISIAFLAWVFLSFIDIAAHNLDETPVYKCWNMFLMFF